MLIGLLCGTGIYNSKILYYNTYNYPLLSHQTNSYITLAITLECGYGGCYILLYHSSIM